MLNNKTKKDTRKSSVFLHVAVFLRHQVSESTFMIASI